MSKVIAGLSEEDAISFTSRTSKIKVHFNGRIEYKEIEKTDEKKLNSSLTLIYVLIFLCESLSEIFIRLMGSSSLVVEVTTIFILIYFVYTINVFSTKESTKRNHAAEHMVYNTNRNGIDLTLENAKKSKVFCEFCGSCLVGNITWLSVINIPLVLLTGFWMPYSFIVWLCKKLSKGLPLNPFTHLIQKGVTAKPSDFNLFISLLAMRLVKDVDVYKEKNGEFDAYAALELLNYEVNELVKENDFDFDTTDLKTIFNAKNGGLWPPFFFLRNIEI